MNNIIEQLAEQVDLLGDFIPTKIPGRYAGTIDIATIEKFAALIVHECINEIHGADVGDLVGKSYYLDLVADHIEKHFRIER